MSETIPGREPWKSKINPWVARPLTDDAKDAKVRQTLSLHAERVILGRSAIIAGWTMGGLGCFMMTVSVVGWVLVLPLKTIQNEIWVADSSTGIIAKPLSIEDAPRSFGGAIDEHFLHQYILAVERWVPETDREDDHLAKIMSSADRQAQINSDRLRPDRAQIAVGNAGHVEIENPHYFQQPPDEETNTRRYLVRFTRTVWRGSAVESREPWTASVAFQWHPERNMTPGDRALNPGGFVDISYSSESDNKDTKRK